MPPYDGMCPYNAAVTYDRVTLNYDIRTYFNILAYPGGGVYYRCGVNGAHYWNP